MSTGEYSKEKGFWSAVWDALRGRGGDLNEGALSRAIIFLAVPMVLEMAMESVFAVVDIFFVARLGSDAVAAVGLTESMVAIVYTIAMGLSIGVTATVARRTGEKDPEGAATATGQSIVMALVIALGLGTLGVLFAHVQVLAMAGAPGRKSFAHLIDTLHYWYIHIGSILLLAGVVTGSMWAASSWGRYWRQ